MAVVSFVTLKMRRSKWAKGASDSSCLYQLGCWCVSSDGLWTNKIYFGHNLYSFPVDM